MEKTEYIASCSFGKDSLAMVLRLIEEKYPLNKVVFYDTGMEFQAIYDIASKIKPLLAKHDIEFVTLKPEYDFEYKAFEKPVIGRNGEMHYGYSWCGGRCRWGTTDKIKILDKYANNHKAYVYVGIAADEPQRIKKEKASFKIMPLVEWGMTEKQCLDFCYKRGFTYEENGIRLYDILDRVSCWCCSNKNRKELKNIYRYLPDYWQKLKDFQSKTDRPMKSFSNKEYGFYGNVFDMEIVFREEMKKKKNEE